MSLLDVLLSNIKLEQAGQVQLESVTESLYKQNLNLSERNKTLSLLRAIDEIVLQVNDVNDVAQGVVSAISSMGEFPLVTMIVGRKGSPYAVSIASAVDSADPKIDELKDILNSLKVGHSCKCLLSQVLVNGGELVSAGLQDVLHDETRAKTKRWQEIMGLAVVFVCPLIVREKVIGILLIGSKNQLADMSEHRSNLIGRLAEVVGISMDNTLLHQEIKESEGRLRRANAHLRELDIAKDEFISMASHQLRTPLTTIKGYLSMLEEGDAGEITESQKEFVDCAFSASERMVGLIADLLNTSRLTTGKFVIDYVDCEAVSMVEDEIRQLKSHATTKGIDLIYKKPRFKSLPVVIDEAKTRQVVMNYIDNAIYYTQHGSVTVELTKDDHNFSVRVTDTGIGVPKSSAKQLFTKFFRADNAQQIRPDGTGLGLYLAKRVVEDQGGRVIFNSEEGKGSIFGFELPIRPKGGAK
jgi:signal transduction histidine kinase